MTPALPSTAAVVPEYFNFVADVFDRHAERRPEAAALWWLGPDGCEERRFTFAELRGLSHRAACMFAAGGIRPEEPVLIMLPRVPAWWISMLGLIRLGALPVPCTTQLTAHDLRYRIDSAGIRAVVTDADGAAKLSGFDGTGWCTCGADGGWRGWETELRRAGGVFDGPRTRADAPGIMFFTSSTTGDPKMVLHTQASCGLGHEVTGRLWLDLRPDDVHWNTSDLGWAKAAWSSFFGPWHAGACVFAWDARGKFSASATLDVLARHPVSTFCAPPTAYRMMLRKNPGTRSYPRLRHCVTAGEPLDPEVFAAWQSATGVMIHEGYGQTETVVLIGHFRSLGTPVVPGSLGLATPGYDIVAVDEDLRAVPGGCEGEIAIDLRHGRPAGLFREFWKCPEETAEHFRGGFYLTGDRATRDKDGRFWFLGRKDDVIKSSGYRIGPHEVESALQTHPAVADAAVIGRPDPERGQIVKAFVVLHAGHAPGDAVRWALQDHCKRLVAPYKYPREIEFLDALPKTTSGKTRRFELRRRDRPGTGTSP